MGRITIMPEGKSGTLREGETLLSHLQRLGVLITVGCGGTGECGTCRVRVFSGAEALSHPTPSEKKLLATPGGRLACQAIVLDEKATIIVEIKGYCRIFDCQRGYPGRIRKRPGDRGQRGEWATCNCPG